MSEEHLNGVMKLIMHGGNAKGLSIQAIRSARKGNFKEAYELIAQAEEELNIAHTAQTEFLFEESQGNGSNVSLLMVHGQDHLMNAITTNDLAKEMIEILNKGD